MVSSSLVEQLANARSRHSSRQDAEWIARIESALDPLERDTMPAQTLESRVERLERRVNGLEKVPERMTALESQIVLLRTEMHEEFSAIRRETHAGGEETQRSLRDEIRSGDEETRQVLRDEIRAGDEETRTLMRVLHEDVVGRIALLGEGRPAQRKQPRK
jgi:hypothetical protein